MRPLAVHEDEGVASRRQETRFTERPRVAEVRALADAPGELCCVRTALGSTTVTTPSCSRWPWPGEKHGDDLVRAGDGFGVNHRDAGMQVAETRICRCRRDSPPRGGGSGPGCGPRIPSGCRECGRRAAARACCPARCCWRARGRLPPSASQRCSTATWVSQQLTQRLQRLRHEHDAAIGQVGGLDVVVRSGG